MRRIRFSAAVSLDGYIAGPDGEIDWIVVDPEIDFSSLVAGFDTVLLGRKTYDSTKSISSGGMPGIDIHVFSRTLRQEACRNVHVSDSPKSVISKLKVATGKDIWLFGGGELFRSMLAEGLVDSIELAIIPVLLGSGLPLFPSPDKREKLRLTDHRIYRKTGTVALTYVPV